MSRPKIALIGGGQVGGNIALLSAQKELGDIIILDIPEAENFMKGKALDISQLLPHDGYDSKLSGTSNFEDIKDSDVVVITAGFPRQPGMNREDLLQKNLDIVTNVANQVKKYAPKAFVIVVSNPLDAMVYAFHKISGFPKNKKYKAVVKPTPTKSSPIRNPRIDRPINDLVNKAVQKIKANTKYVKIFLTESDLIIVCILFTLC